MTAIAVDIVVILVLILLNGLLAMSEIAIVSARKPRLAQRALDGDRRAQAALSLAEAPTRFLSTVQVGITLVGILVGALGGATIAEWLGAQINRIPGLAPYGEAAAVAAVVLIVTYLSVVIGELVPKRLGLDHAERIAVAAAPPMRLLSSLASPAVRLLAASTELVLRALRVHPSPEPPVTEQEVELMMDEGAEHGVFEEAERDIVRRVFRLTDRRAASLMTHRTDIEWLDLDEPEEIAGRIVGHVHSCFPVARGSLDNILGVARTTDLLANCLQGKPLDPKAVLRPPLFVPESAPALEVLQRLKEGGQPMALVLDEFGGLEGLLTPSDILEALVGDVPADGEGQAAEAVRRADGTWLLDGLLPVGELKEILQVDHLPGEEERFETLGGFVMAWLGKVPSTADHFHWEGFCFEVMDMDGLRVDKVLVSPAGRGPCGAQAAGNLH